MKHYRNVFAGKDQHARTPPALLAHLRAHFRVQRFHDVCPSNPTVDGLSVPWPENCFCNPPYARIGPWVAHALAQANTRTVFLIPVRFYAKYMQAALLSGRVTVWFLRHKVTFQNYRHPLHVGLAAISVGRFRTVAPPTHQVHILQTPRPWHLAHVRRFLPARTEILLSKPEKRLRALQGQAVWVLLPAVTKNGWFFDVVLKSPFVGFFNHLLRPAPDKSDFCQGSLLVCLGRGAPPLANLKVCATVRAGILFNNK